MTPDAILARYRWVAGTCFRCGGVDVFVTLIDEIVTPRGERYPLSACGGCVLHLEDERRRYADRKGLTYEPGTLGQAQP